MIGIPTTALAALAAGFGLVAGAATVIACALVRAGAQQSQLQSALFAAELRRRSASAAPNPLRPPLPVAA